MLPLIQKEIIEGHGWLTLSEFMNIIAVAEMTPGPLAINSATFIGFRTGGFWGAVLATSGVITPSLIIMVLAAAFMTHFNRNCLVQAALSGIRPAVIALITGAAIFVGKAAFVDYLSFIIGISVFILLVFFKMHPVLVLLLSAVSGILLY